MKYDIEKEEQQFMNFINDQYNVYKEIDNIYRDYVKLPLLLSDALFTLSKHAGMYAMMRLTNEGIGHCRSQQADRFSVRYRWPALRSACNRH